jgi:hypothetical protein
LDSGLACLNSDIRHDGDMGHGLQHGRVLLLLLLVSSFVVT